MSPVTFAWSAAWIVMGAAAVARLVRRSNSPEPFIRTAYRMLAVAAACLAAGGTIQEVMGGVLGGPQPLRIADLISLAALPALVIGLATITAERVRTPDGRMETSRWRRRQAVGADGSTEPWPQPGAVLDSALLVVSLFTIGLVTLFGTDYSGSGIGRAAFAVDLIRPVIGLLALGVVVLLLPRSPRLVALPGLALLAVTIGDSLAVGARLTGVDSGVGSHLALVIGLVLLALTPEPKAAEAEQDAGTERRHWVPSGDWAAQVRIIALAAAVTAVAVIAGVALFGRLTAVSAVAVFSAVIVALLVLRLVWAIRQAASVTASARAAGSVFRTLADSTSDTVLICDLAGTIEYISPAVGDLGYGPTQLTGTRLADVVHPEDRPAGIAAMLAALRAESGTGTFHGRVRGADGSWRQVSATLSRYSASRGGWAEGEAGGTPLDPRRRPGELAKMMITCRDDSELVALRQQVTQLTFHDGLTGLPNRAYLEDRVKDLSHGGGLRTGPDGERGLAAILVGLDGHALMHDLAGQPGENLVVAQAGRRLRAAVPPGALVARWAGDQFAVLIGDLGPGEDDFGGASTGPVAELAQRLTRAISDEPFSVADKEISLTACAGVATCAYGGADQVLGHAQLAMLKARESGGCGQSGGSRVEIFGPQLQALTKRRADLAAKFGEAIADHQLTICYRPVADLLNSRVTWAEVLVSWPVGDKLIGGDELLVIAEDAALVGKFTDWVLREACHQVAAWRTGDSAIGLMVACSARQVSAVNHGAGGFAEAVLGAAQDAGLPPQALTLLVAERVLVDGTGPVVTELAGLRTSGVRLAIDGFGTGYASLSFLRRLAVDSIKIDPSFVAGLGGDPTLTLLTSAIAGLGRDLGIEVIATGIETADQAELLKSMGCGLGQGNWIAGPVSPDAVDPACVGTVAGWTTAAGASSGHKAGDPACSPAS
jgi:diguanylate cyclase (GGDEF)-like protein/PAS domain S-box-containing protein